MSEHHQNQRSSFDEWPKKHDDIISWIRSSPVSPSLIIDYSIHQNVISQEATYSFTKRPFDHPDIFHALLQNKNTNIVWSRQLIYFVVERLPPESTDNLFLRMHEDVDSGALRQDDVQRLLSDKHTQCALTSKMIRLDRFHQIKYLTNYAHLPHIVRSMYDNFSRKHFSLPSRNLIDGLDTVIGSGADLSSLTMGIQLIRDRYLHMLGNKDAYGPIIGAMTNAYMDMKERRFSLNPPEDKRREAIFLLIMHNVDTTHR